MLMINLNLGQNQPFKCALMDIDFPNQAGMRHEEACLLNGRPITQGAHHLFGFGDGDLIFEFRAANPHPRPLHSKPCTVLLEPNANLAFSEACDEAVAQPADVGDGGLPIVVGYEELSLKLMWH